MTGKINPIGLSLCLTVILSFGCGANETARLQERPSTLVALNPRTSEPNCVPALSVSRRSAVPPCENTFLNVRL